MSKLMIPVPPRNQEITLNQKGFMYLTAYHLSDMNYSVERFLADATAPKVSSNTTYNGGIQIAKTYFPRDPKFEYISYKALLIYTGAKPTQADIDKKFLTPSTWGDQLLGYIEDDFETSIDVDHNTNEFIISIDTDFIGEISLSKSGPATWWMMCDKSYYDGWYTSDHLQYSDPFPFVIGDISNLAGNGEMKMEDTQLNGGQTFCITEFSFRFPAHINVT